MCGRFTLRAPASVIAEQFAIFEAAPFAPRFNIAPSQPVPVIRMAPDQPQPRRELVWLRWGLIPVWAEDPKIGNRMINARADGIAQKPAFRTAMRRRRCLVAADGFYEWQRTGRRKQPYFVRMRDERPFAFAGLWERWERTGQGPIESCTILTTDANDVVRPIHDRMPVILAPSAYEEWLDPDVQDPQRLAPLLTPYPAEPMTAYAIRTLVNSPTNEDPRCVEPILQHEGPASEHEGL